MSTNPILVCVIHDKKFNTRLQTLNSVINKFISGFKVVVIDKHNHEELLLQDIRDNVKLESPDSKTFFDSMVKSMHVKQVSQALKHKLALETFVNQDTFDTMLVIEDDVLCGENINTDLNNAMQILDAHAEVDMLLLGCPTPRQIAASNVSIAKVLDCFRLLPTCDAYLIKKDKAAKLLEILTPIRYTISNHLSFLASCKNFNIYMLAPNIFINGSKYGLYVSSIDQNNKLFLNPDYNKIAILNTKQSYTQEEYDSVIKMTSEVSLREHPDFQVAFGNFFMRLGKYQQAKEYFDRAYKLYLENDCILNNECEFMSNYTKLFGYLQNDRDIIYAKLDKK